jgi:serine protease Do
MNTTNRHLGSGVTRTCAVLALAWMAVQAIASETPQIKIVPTAQPPRFDGAPGSRSVVYNRTLVSVTNERFGIVGRGYFCSTPVPLVLNSAMVNFVSARFATAAQRELRQLGYGDAVGEQSAFTKAASATGDFELAGTVRELSAHLCVDSANDIRGSAWMQIRWELFASRQQRVVYSVTTEGSFSTDGKWQALRLDDAFERSFTSAFRNALADKEMAQWMRADVAKLSAAEAASTKAVTRLALAREPAADEKPDGDFSTQRSAVVTVFSGVGSGSGFFIDAQGYLLTNQHVVGDAKYVKVRLANGRDLVGEVMRSHTGRDVALVKTEAVALRPFSLSVKPPAVGEEVLVIGSPLGDTFAGNLSKGVLSGSSTLREQRFWQSDAKILPGSSGGPMLRRDGSVVGIAQGAIGHNVSAGVNLFVPIDEALNVLGIDFAPQSR